MRLYHFTCIAHLPSILRCGYIDSTDSCLLTRQDPDDHPVVWFTSEASNSHDVQLWEGGSKAAQSSKSHADDTAIQAARTITDKTRIRITVELPVSKKDPRLEKEAACYMWDHWSRCIGREKRWIQTFHRLYGNWRAWYVFDHRLLPRSWVRIEDTATGEVLWTQDGLTHLGQSLIEKHEKDVEDLIVWRCTSKGVHRK